MSKVSRVVLVSAVALAAAGLRTFTLRQAVAAAQSVSPASDSAWALAHYDHRPRQGGLVLMNGDTHFEVVLDTTGGYSVYFSSGVRAPLPATIASEVRVAVIPSGRPRETIAMEPDLTNSYWAGRGTPVDDPDAIIRVGYTADATPYWIDVPASAWLSLTAPRSQ
jgi:hypothetical protein